MPALARGLSKKPTPAEIANRELQVIARDERAAIAAEIKREAEEKAAELVCRANAMVFFDAMLLKKTTEQRDGFRATKKFHAGKGEGYDIEPSENGFTIQMTYREGGHTYAKSAEWNRGKAQLTQSKWTTL